MNAKHLNIVEEKNPQIFIIVERIKKKKGRLENS